MMETTDNTGLLTAISLDIYKNITNFEEKIEIDITPIEPVVEIPPEKKVEYNITDIDFSSLIANEKDDSVNTLHKYFASQNPTNRNEMTGIFKDKNLIFITAEAFYPIAVDKDLTPTLYKLVNEGIKFNNYYQPIYGCSTSDGEFVNLLGLLPGISTCSMDRTHDVYLPYVIGNSFKKYGYDTYAIHGWTYTYYHRDKSYPNLGFEKYYGYDRLKKGYKYALPNIKYSWPTSDIDVINSAYPIFSQSEKYVTYMMSISGHLQYSWGGNAMSRKNKDLVKGVKASESIKAYIAANIEFDRSLEILLKDLEESGTLKDTVIVIAADHYPYGLTNDEIKSYVDWVQNETFDIYRNNLIIYNSELTGITVDKNVGSIDILPTLLNMFGIEYDSRLLIGHDVFSDASDLVIFNNKSWVTDKGRYDYLKKKFYPFEGVEVDQDYIKKINSIISTKFQVSKSILQKNYYKKVLGE
ncbi:MAG: LTA synthase family protein, partial [Bacilli bacterium]|nr:LTA synthase family protein [Bacilli bacterium]